MRLASLPDVSVADTLEKRFSGAVSQAPDLLQKAREKMTRNQKKARNRAIAARIAFCASVALALGVALIRAR